MKISANVCMAVIAIFLMSVSVGVAGDDGWKMLFNEKDFTGFKQLNGTAPYTVVDGMMVGTTKHNTPNSFMATEKTYGDFILEVDLLVGKSVV